MSHPSSSGFDRLRPRTPVTVPAEDPDQQSWTAPLAGPHPDSTGRRALFSVSEPGIPAFGSVSIECSSCHEVSVLAFRQALRLAVPSLYLPVLRRRYPAWLHCPACGDWAWTKVKVRV